MRDSKWYSHEIQHVLDSHRILCGGWYIEGTRMQDCAQLAQLLGVNAQESFLSIILQVQSGKLVLNGMDLGEPFSFFYTKGRIRFCPTKKEWYLFPWGN